MAADDRAIVVGIRRYPGLDDLNGPENDAHAFHDWLISDHGGDVPPANIDLIVSSGFPDVAIATGAQPKVDAFQDACERLDDIAIDNSSKGLGSRTGRRLYIYLAGHGFEPQVEQVALLCANATRQRTHHIAARKYADWFRYKGTFDEVLLFMDCCREPLSRATLTLPPYMLEFDSHAPERGKWMAGYATKWSRTSREKMVGDKPRGIFTVALLRGLTGEAADSNGEITAESLSNFLYDHMKDLLTAEEFADSRIPKQPDMTYDKDPLQRLVITKVLPPLYDIELGASAGAVGMDLTIFDNAFGAAYQTKIVETVVRTRLPRGLYMAQILPAGTKKTFQVPSDEQGEVIHVSL